MAANSVRYRGWEVCPVIVSSEECMQWTSDVSRIYSRCNSPSGIAVILYMEESRSMYGRADACAVIRLWQNLGFTVIPHPNPSKQDLDMIINDLKAEINAYPDKHDFFCFTFIGHGGCVEYDGPGGFKLRCEYLLLNNDTKCEVNQFYDMFSPSHFRGLAGKPKMIFIQACRGQTGEIPSQIWMSANTTISQRSDIYILNSSFPDHESYYDLLTGNSYFFKILCEVFNEHFRDLDLQSMSRIVINKICKMNFNGQAQTPHEFSTLRMLLYFYGIQGSTLPKLINPTMGLGVGATSASHVLPGLVVSNASSHHVSQEENLYAGMNKQETRTASLKRTVQNFINYRKYCKFVNILNYDITPLMQNILDLTYERFRFINHFDESFEKFILRIMKSRRNYNNYFNKAEKEKIRHYNNLDVSLICKLISVCVEFHVLPVKPNFYDRDFIELKKICKEIKDFRNHLCHNDIYVIDDETHYQRFIEFQPRLVNISKEIFHSSYVDETTKYNKLNMLLAKIPLFPTEILLICIILVGFMAWIKCCFF